MRFTKIKCQSEKVHLEWTTPAENAEAQLVEHRLASDEAPHPDFRGAMQAFRHEVGRLLELPELWSKEIEVIGLSINHEDDGRLGLVITCLRPLSMTNAPLVINTPHLREADAEEEGNFLPTSILGLLDMVATQAERYVHGTRDQASLFDAAQEFVDSIPEGHSVTVSGGGGKSVTVSR